MRYNVIGILSALLVLGTACEGNRMTVNEFSESEKAFANADKGLRAGPTCPYSTLNKVYVKWNDIENSESDGVDKILHYSDSVFNPLFRQGIRVIPRVYLAWPFFVQNAAGTRLKMYSYGRERFIDCFWPEDMTPGDYSSSQFEDRTKKLIAKLGQAWDNDERVAFVEMGIIGNWGEQHSPSPSLGMQKLLADSYLAAFKNKKIMVRNYNEFTDYSFGYYWDSFAHWDQRNHYEGILDRGDIWKHAVMGGEVAYDYGNIAVQPGKSPDISLSDPKHLDYIIDCVRDVHANHLGWISKYTVGKPDVDEGAAKLQKALGYRFVVDRACYNKTIKGKLKTVLEVRNVGSSPMYYDYKVQYSLMDPVTHKSVWSGLSSTRTSEWMPGENWNKETRQYDNPPCINVVKDKFSIPADIPSGEYLLCVTMVNKEASSNYARFAVDNYIKGGYTVLGRVGLRTEIESCGIEGLTFDDLSADRLIPLTQKLTSRPPLGWNSYDSYGLYIYEDAAIRNADAMAEILKPHGYEYFILDAGWFAEYEYYPGTRIAVHRDSLHFDAYGVLQPSKTGFPNGFKPLIDRVHANGLKFGLHLMRGIPRQAYRANVRIKGTKYHAEDIADTTDRCAWSEQNYGVDMDKPGAQEYYNSILNQLAEWGVDFVKYDDIVPHPREVEAVTKAVAQCGRDIVLSLSPGDTVDDEAIVTFEAADMLRVTGDVWDFQKDIDKCFVAWKRWQGRKYNNLWIDMDMIPFGELQVLAPDPRTYPGTLFSGVDQMSEYQLDHLFSGRGFRRWCQLDQAQMRTFMTIRAMSASPLMVGGDLTTMDEYSLELLTNKEMLACDQNGIIGTLQYEKDSIEVWRTPSKDGKGGWIGIFNCTDEDKSEDGITYKELGLSRAQSKLKDIWSGTDVDLNNTLTVGKRDVLFFRY